MNDYQGSGSKAWRGLYIHFTTYVVVNSLLVAVNFATTPDRLWVQWPLLGWGVGLLAHTTAVLTRGVRKGSA